MRHKFAVAIFFLATVACAAAQTERVYSALLADSAGNKLTGTLEFTPTLSSGASTWYRMPGGGAATNAPILAPVTSGAFSITLPDTTVTSPANICFAMSMYGGKPIAGYQCLQPHVTPANGSDWCQSAGCDLDNYVPNLAPAPTIGYVQSVNGCTGVCTVSATAGTVAPTVGDSDVTAQTASQSTVIVVSAAPATGKYRIGYYANQHAICGSGMVTVLFTFNWVDPVSARAASSIALTIGPTQAPITGSIQGSVPIYVLAATAVTYTSTVTGSCATGGPASYDAHIAVEEVQ
jgi:hypothetical protein